MRTRSDIEAATPRCQAIRQELGVAHANVGRRGGFIRGTVERLCLKPMRYHAADGTWICQCGSTQSGLLLGTRAVAFSTELEAA